MKTEFFESKLQLFSKIFKRKKQTNNLDSLVGVSVDEHGIAIAHMIGSIPGKLVVKAHAYSQAVDKAAKQEVLSKFVEQNSLKGHNCAYVLSLTDYAVDLIEAPKVEKSEMTKAVRWAVKEVVDYPVDTAIVDCFELPIPRASDNVTMAYAAVMPPTLIPEVEALINGSGLKLKFINIRELALRNIVMLDKNNENGSLLLRMHSLGGEILLSRKDTIFISRKMDLNLDKFLVTKKLSAEEVTDDDEILDQLSLDVQRSMDYCSSIFRQSPARCIILTPSVIDRKIACKYLNEHLGLDVHSMDLSEYMTFEQDITPEQQSDCLIAIGGALHNVRLENK
jgi:MSHA biogenesis protein MshI